MGKTSNPDLVSSPFESDDPQNENRHYQPSAPTTTTTSTTGRGHTRKKATIIASASFLLLQIFFVFFLVPVAVAEIAIVVVAILDWVWGRVFIVVRGAETHDWLVSKAIVCKLETILFEDLEMGVLVPRWLPRLFLTLQARGD